MRSPLLMLTIALAILGSGQSPGLTDEPLKVADLTENVKVRLLAARRGAAATAPLVAQFVPLDDENRELLVQFHSLPATPHERTLMNLVEACVGGCGPDAGTNWKKAKVEVLFSIPKNGIDSRNRKDYEKCYLVSVKLTKGN